VTVDADAEAEVEAGPRPSRRTSSRRRWWPPVTSLVLGVGFAVWGLSIGIDQLSDNSFFTHLATGRLILDSGIPHHDPYSFTALGEPWVVQSWLASLLYGLVDSWFGIDGLRLFMAALTGVLGAMVWRLTRPAKALAGRIVIAGCVLGIGSAVWAPRPLLIGLVLLTITLLAAEKGLDPRWLVPVFWVWVNVHGSFPLGLVALGCLWLGRRADGKEGKVELRCLLWAVGGTVLGVVNPLGPILLVFPVRLLGRMDVLSEVIEWQSPSFSLMWTRLFLVQVAIGVVVLVRRPSYRAAIPLVVFTLAALLGVRNIAVASIVLVPGLARGLTGLGSIRGDRRNPLNGVAIGALALVGVLLVSNGLAKPAWQLETFPVDAVAWLDQNGLHSADVHTATPDTVGNYLELLYGDQAHAFVDDRVDMYPKPVIEDFLVLLHASPGWRDVLDRRDVDLVLWERTQALTGVMAESSDWRIIYSDPSWVVSCRRGAELGGSGSLATC
jgi:hypothetical protein